MKSFDVAAVVSGGASGLGEATVRALVARGAAVTVLDLQEEKGKGLAAELGGHTTFVRTDVTDADSVQAAVAEATGKDRPLRIAVNCAGIGWAQRTVGKGNVPHDLDPFVRTVMVNLVGTFNVLRLAAAAMAATEPEECSRRGPGRGSSPSSARGCACRTGWPSTPATCPSTRSSSSDRRSTRRRPPTGTRRS